MSNAQCQEFQFAMDQQPPPAALLEHLSQCPECAATYGLMGQLRSGDPFPEPSEAEFLALRRGVLRELRRAPVRSRNGLRLAWLLSCAAAAALAVWLGGRGAHGQISRPGPGAEDPLVTQIKLEARTNPGLPDPDKGPNRYDNVRAVPEPGGQVLLSFDVSRHVALTLPQNDPLVSEVLLQALAGSAPVGTRLQAIACTGSTLDPRVRDGLVRAMLLDPNLGVRLKAQARLIEQNGDPKVQEALLHVLQHEASVQMKLVAIDYLTSHQVSPRLLQQAVDPAGRRDAAYLKLMNYVNEKGGPL